MAWKKDERESLRSVLLGREKRPGICDFYVESRWSHQYPEDLSDSAHKGTKLRLVVTARSMRRSVGSMPLVKARHGILWPI